LLLLLLLESSQGVPNLLSPLRLLLLLLLLLRLRETFLGLMKLSEEVIIIPEEMCLPSWKRSCGRWG
jgi:hypothetical protein